MQVINKETSLFDGKPYSLYTFDTGHQYRKWGSGEYVAYTAKGNYASQVTAHKLARMVRQYEDNKAQD